MLPAANWQEVRDRILLWSDEEMVNYICTQMGWPHEYNEYLTIAVPPLWGTSDNVKVEVVKLIGFKRLENDKLEPRAEIIKLPDHHLDAQIIEDKGHRMKIQFLDDSQPNAPTAIVVPLMPEPNMARLIGHAFCLASIYKNGV